MRTKKMNENLNNYDRKIKCSLPAWYVFNCCMESVKDLVSAPEKLEQWEEVLDFLIDTDFFWECNVSFEEVVYGLIKNDEVRFIGVDDLSKEGLKYYVENNKNIDLDLIGKDNFGNYELDDDNYITTLKDNTIVIWAI